MKSIEIIKSKSENNLDLYYDYLVEYLSNLSDEDICKWNHIFDEYQKLSYKEKLWAAAYVNDGGCSDDGFDYFRAWLTSRGKETFLNTLKAPDSLADYKLEKDSLETIVPMLCKRGDW